MADEMVRQVQIWINQTYDTGMIEPVETDGITGGTTVKALIKALQIELGVSPVDGVFGADTMNKLPVLSTDYTSNEFTVSRLVRILQGAMYCKGYNPGGFDGAYGTGLEKGIISFKTDAGLSAPSGKTEPKVFKALLNTDGYKLSVQGQQMIRTVQQQLNDTYFSHEKMDLIPSWGIYDKMTNRSLIKAIQIESNLTADGVWGNNTMNACPTLRRYGTVDNKRYVYLLQYALAVNGFDPNGFDGGFGAGVQKAVKNFQEFVGLSADGVAGKQTWASLLVSYGDKNRVGKACDCSTILDVEKINALVNNGREVVGRYIAGGVWKRLTAGELNLILAGGLKVFPIYQTSANELGYFYYTKGCSDAKAAIKNSSELRLPKETAIYFAVDVDAYDKDVKGRIKSYFKGIHDVFTSAANVPFAYKAGVYGSRNVCSTMAAAGYTEASFVSDMSSGFSGNIGYKLPADWVYDQISTISVKVGDNSTMAIDNDIWKKSFHEVAALDKEIFQNLSVGELDYRFLEDADLRLMIAYSYLYGEAVFAGDYALADAFYLAMRMIRRQEKYKNVYEGYMDADGNYDEAYTYYNREETDKYQILPIDNERYEEQDIAQMKQTDQVAAGIISMMPVLGDVAGMFVSRMLELQQGVEDNYTVVSAMRETVNTRFIAEIMEKVSERGAKYFSVLGLLKSIADIVSNLNYAACDEEDVYYYTYESGMRFRIEPNDCCMQIRVRYRVAAEETTSTEYIVYTHKDYPAACTSYLFTETIA